MPSQLSELVSQVSLKLSEETPQEFYTEADVKQAIGDSYRYYVMKLIQLGAGFFEETVLLNIVGGVETISVAGLTPPFWKVSLIEKIVTNGRIPLKPYERRYEMMATNGVGAGSSYIPTYKMRGLNIVLEPPPGASETQSVKLDYVYIPTFPVSTTIDTFTFDEQFPDIYEVNVVLRSCVKLLEEKDAVGGVSDTATFRQELEMLDKSFDDTLNRDEIPDDITYVGEDYENIYDT